MSHTASGQTTSYTWDVAASLPVVLKDNTYTYVYGLDLISATDSGGNQNYYMYNGQGSVANIVDYNGNEKALYFYDAFGNPRYAVELTSNVWRYTGEQRDADSGLYYLRARYYDPATGRFLSQDPARAGHAYAYVENNPVSFVDPRGLDACKTALGWAGVDDCDDVTDKAEDIATKPLNDVSDTIDNIGVLVDHPGSVIQQTVGLIVARGSFGDRFERDGAVFYTECWGLCSVFRLGARNITLGHFVFSQGNPREKTILHELEHVRQGDEGGLLWPYRYFREWIERGYKCNRFEEEARMQAGQPSRCHPKE